MTDNELLKLADKHATDYKNNMTDAYLVLKKRLDVAVETLKEISTFIISKSYRGSDAGTCAAQAFHISREALEEILK